MQTSLAEQAPVRSNQPCERSKPGRPLNEQVAEFESRFEALEIAEYSEEGLATAIDALRAARAMISRSEDRVLRYARRVSEVLKPELRRLVRIADGQLCKRTARRRARA